MDSILFLLRKNHYNFSMFVLKPIFIIILSIISFNAHSRLFLNVSIVNKKGIDKGLTLGSELHSIEEVNRKENIVLKMRSGIQVVLNARFSDKPQEDTTLYGPSSEVMITGKILDDRNKVLKDFSEKPLYIALDDSSVVIHSKDSQLVEVSIVPHLK